MPMMQIAMDEEDWVQIDEEESEEEEEDSESEYSEVEEEFNTGTISLKDMKTLTWIPMIHAGVLTSFAKIDKSGKLVMKMKI